MPDPENQTFLRFDRSCEQAMNFQISLFSDTRHRPQPLRLRQAVHEAAGTSANFSDRRENTLSKDEADVGDGARSDRLASMRLRAERPRVTRLSRKALAGAAALGSAAIFGATSWALQNNQPRSAAPSELFTTDHHKLADGLAGLPRDYAAFPRKVSLLGPAFPGDLGRPILHVKDASSTESRILLVWTRLIMPNGRSLVLERQPATDAAGYAGLEDKVDSHWADLFRAALLPTLLGVGSELGSTTGAGSNSDIITALRRGSSDSLNQTGQKVVQQNLNIQPTLTIRPGFSVRVMVNRDLLLEPYKN